MALPDVPDTYRVILRGQLLGDEVLNVFHYRDTLINSFDPVDVAQGFWDNIKTQLRAWMPTSGGFTFSQVSAEFLNDDHPFGVYNIPAAEQVGTRATGASEWMPVWSAGLVTLRVGTRVTRPGSKRFAGLVESDQSQGTLIAGTVTLLQALADRLDIAYTPTGAVATVTPVIVGYPTPLQPGNPRVQDVVEAVASPYVSHQVSRDIRP